MRPEAQYWKDDERAKFFLDRVRGAIPLADEQIMVMLRLLRALDLEVERFLDLGCGDGVLAAAILGQHPQSRGVLLDFSEEMLRQARERFAPQPFELNYVLADYTLRSWVDIVADCAPFDAVVSGFSIHHQTDERKRELYQEVFNLLKPGGLFVNIENVASPTPWVHARFEELFVDCLFEHNRKLTPGLSRQQMAEQYFNRPDRAADILAPVEDQCGWLREIGFQDVDCYFKIFEMAAFGGRRSAAAVTGSCQPRFPGV